MPNRFEVAVADRLGQLVWELPDDAPDDGVEVSMPHEGHEEGTCVECDAYRDLLTFGRLMTIPELRDRFGRGHRPTDK